MANLLEDPDGELKVEDNAVTLRLAALRDQDDPAESEPPTDLARFRGAKMTRHTTRRDFLKASTGRRRCSMRSSRSLPSVSRPRIRPMRQSVRVVVWDEQQPAQKQAYADFLGNQIAAHLREQPGISVRSVRLDDPGQGLAGDVLDELPRADLVGARAASGDRAGGRQGDRPEDQGGDSLAHRAPLGPLVDAVRRGHERADADRRREVDQGPGR